VIIFYPTLFISRPSWLLPGEETASIMRGKKLFALAQKLSQQKTDNRPKLLVKYRRLFP
jgi:hypothetical protein